MKMIAMRSRQKGLFCFNLKEEYWHKFEVLMEICNTIFTLHAIFFLVHSKFLLSLRLNITYDVLECQET